MNGFGHDLLIKNAKPKLAFDKEVDYNEWRREVKEKFFDLLGMDQIEQNAAKDPEFKIEATEEKDGYTQIRCSYFTENEVRIPCYVLIPHGLENGEKRPVAITLQGHTTGFHNSVGIPKSEEDEEYQNRNGRFAVQAVKEGYIAVAIELRGRGEIAAENQPDRRVWVFGRAGCYYEATTAILLGRTIIGERCFDIKCTIDMLDNFKDVCDLDKIFITGHSGGGTASFYSACYDERIKLSAPSCAFCPYPESILKFYHCSCNYIPGAFKYFDMQDLACLIAPRQLLLVNGKLDPSFLIEGVRRGYETVKGIYKAAGAENNCKSIETEEGHYWCTDIMWSNIKEELAKLK